MYPSVVKSNVHMQVQGLEQELGILIDRQMLNRLKKKFPNGPLPEEEDKETGQRHSYSVKRKKSPPRFFERFLRHFW